MMRFRKSLAVAIACVSMIANLTVARQASAFPAAPASTASGSHGGGVTPVYWRGHGGWGWWGPGAFFGGVVGGALIAAAVAEHRADRVDMDRCARDFPDFSYRTGTYIDRRGIERVCPYLR